MEKCAFPPVWRDPRLGRGGGITLCAARKNRCYNGGFPRRLEEKSGEENAKRARREKKEREREKSLLRDFGGDFGRVERVRGRFTRVRPRAKNPLLPAVMIR